MKADREPFDHVCEIYSWCPVEIDEIPMPGYKLRCVKWDFAGGCMLTSWLYFNIASDSLDLLECGLTTPLHKKVQKAFVLASATFLLPARQWSLYMNVMMKMYNFQRSLFSTFLFPFVGKMFHCLMLLRISRCLLKTMSSFQSSGNHCKYHNQFS